MVRSVDVAGGLRAGARVGGAVGRAGVHGARAGLSGRVGEDGGG